MPETINFVQKWIGNIMDYLPKDEKQGHVTCGNRLAIECLESFQKFTCLEEELLSLLRPVGTLQDFVWLDLGKMTPVDKTEMLFFNLQVMPLIF